MKLTGGGFNFHISQLLLNSQFHKHVVFIVEEQLSALPQTVGLAQCLGAGFVSGCPADGLALPYVWVIGHESINHRKFHNF